MTALNQSMRDAAGVYFTPEAVIRSATGDCGYQVPHVFDCLAMPPKPDRVCRCGKQTWKNAELAAMKKAAKASNNFKPMKLKAEIIGEYRLRPAQVEGDFHHVQKRGASGKWETHLKTQSRAFALEWIKDRSATTRKVFEICK